MSDQSDFAKLPTIVRHALKNAGITTMAALESCTKESLLDLPNVGVAGANSVIKFLALAGLKLSGEDGATPVVGPQSVSLPFEIMQLVDENRGHESRSEFVSRLMGAALRK